MGQGPYLDEQKQIFNSQIHKMTSVPDVRLLCVFGTWRTGTGGTAAGLSSHGIAVLPGALAHQPGASVSCEP